MRLRNKPTYLRTVDEVSVKQQKANWSQRFYILFLFALIFAVGFYIFNKVYYVRGYGQIQVEKTSIQYLDDIKIKKIYVQENKSVQMGTRLFDFERDDRTADLTTVMVRNPRNDLLALKKELAFAINELQRLNREYDFYAQKQKRYERLNIIGTIAPEELSALDERLVMLAGRIEEQKGDIDALKEQQRMNNQSQSPLPKVFNTVEYCTASAAGRILKIYSGENEVVLKGTTIMDVQNGDNISMRAYFELADAENIHVGSNVIVQFPDGSKASGIIHRFSLTTIPQPVEFQQKYEPTHRSIVAQIVPTVDSRSIWMEKNFNKMSATILIPKWRPL